MTLEDFDVQLLLAREAITEWLVKAGAEVADSDDYGDFDDEDDEEFGDELTTLLLDDIEFYIGPATCDSSQFEEWVTDKDFKLVAVSRNGHHHLEIAAVPVLGSPLPLSVLDDLVRDLQPDEPEAYVKVGDTFSDGSMKTSFCDPFAIEVRDDGGSNNVWVVRRFRIDDTTSEDFDSLMSEVVNLAREVRDKVES